jgi:hypothetical protein
VHVEDRPVDAGEGANASAIPRPIPRVPPVIAATFPSSFMSLRFL